MTQTLAKILQKLGNSNKIKISIKTSHFRFTLVRKTPVKPLFYLFFLRYLKKHSFCSECTHMVNKAYSLLVDDGACPAALESIEDVTECSGGGGDNHCHANNPLPLPPNQVRPLIIYFLYAKPLGLGIMETFS